jgi:mRNA interferase MazF
VVIERWTIYWANLDPTQGSEQAGNRPVLVVSADEVNVLHQVSVLPLTSLKDAQRKIRKNEALLLAAESGLSRDAIVLAHQVRTLDKSRLESIAGNITSAQTKERVLAAIRVQFGM